MFDDTGWKLTVHGSLEKLPGPYDLPPKQSAIWGETVDGRRVSLFDGYCVSRNRFSMTDNRPKEEWIGLHYSVGRTHVTLDTFVKRLEIRFDALGEWGCWSSSRLYNYAEGTITIPDHTAYTVQHKGARVSLVCSWMVTDSIDSATVTRETFLTVEDDIQIRDLQAKWVSPLQGFLSFLILDYATITETTVRLSDPDQSLTLHLHTPKPITQDTGPQERVHMLLTHGQLVASGMNLDTILDNWFQLTGPHRTALNLIQLLYTNPTLHPPAALLIAFMAIEAYHQAEFDASASPQAEYADKICRVLETIPEEYQQWVKERLLSGNRKGQKRKYREVSEIAVSTRGSIESSWPTFETTVIKQRQKAAHPAETDLNDAISCQAARVGLLWILRHVYLVRMGLSSDAAERLIIQNQIFQQDLEQLAEWYKHLDTS